MTQKKLQRPPAEVLFSKELTRLKQTDKGEKPPGWKLSPLAVEKFILGDDELNIQSKFVGPRALVSRIIVTLITNRGSMLVGIPGTAKSLLSELLSAAISGQSTLIIQGGAITNINQLLYSWNEALLKSSGPSQEALIAGPLLRGMKEGVLVRFEEMARCPTQIQDAILNILSERQIAIPELKGKESILFAREGFNIIGTSNTLDKGVHAMSAALKRRMNFETIPPIQNIEDEIEVVMREAHRLIHASGIQLDLNRRLMECLVTIFHELRNGQSLDGRSTDRLASTVMSTAEAVSVAHAMGMHAHYYRDGQTTHEDLVHFLIGASVKDNPDDRRRLRHYFESEVATKQGSDWAEIYQYKRLL